MLLSTFWDSNRLSNCVHIEIGIRFTSQATFEIKEPESVLHYATPFNANQRLFFTFQHQILLALIEFPRSQGKLKML